MAYLYAPQHVSYAPGDPSSGRLWRQVYITGRPWGLSHNVTSSYSCYRHDTKPNPTQLGSWAEDPPLQDLLIDHLSTMISIFHDGDINSERKLRMKTPDQMWRKSTYTVYSAHMRWYSKLQHLSDYITVNVKSKALATRSSLTPTPLGLHMNGVHKKRLVVCDLVSEGVTEWFMIHHSVKAIVRLMERLKAKHVCNLVL